MSAQSSPATEFGGVVHHKDSDAWAVRVVNSPRPAEVRSSRGAWQMKFELTPLKPGEHSVHLPSLRYRRSPEEDWRTITWKPIRVMVTTTLDPNNAGLTDMKTDVPGPEGLPEPPSWWRSWRPWLIGAGAAVALTGLALAGWLLSRRRYPWAMPLAPHEWALHELRRVEALGLPATGKVERYFTLLSDLVRGYIEKRFGIRAPRLTTAEFLEAVRQSPELKPEQQTLLRDFLQRCDLVKFARASLSVEECQAAAAPARAFVEQTAQATEPKEEKTT